MTAASGFSRVKTEKAADISRHFKLDPKALALLDEGASVRAYLQRLAEQEHFPEALEFLAHALAPRDAVWWGSLCLWIATGSDAGQLTPDDREALRSAVVWVVEPSEEHRRAAEGPSNRAKGAAACLALAAFFSGGSITPPNLPVVPPKPFVTAKSVAAGLLMASAINGGLKTAGYQRRFLELGEQIADGKLLWDDPEVLKTFSVAT